MTSKTPRPERVNASPEAVWLLLERYRCGDVGAVNELITGLYPTVRKFVWRMAYAPQTGSEREDLVQDCLEQICRALDGFEGKAQLTTFAYGVCFRVVSRHRRRQRVRRLFRREAADVCTPAGFDEPEAAMERALNRRRARAAIANLSLEERGALVLFEAEGLSIEEIAHALGLSPRTVKRRLSAARTKLLRLREEAAS